MSGSSPGSQSGSGASASGSNPLPYRYAHLRSYYFDDLLLYSAQAGFNRGDGSGFYALPGSGTSEILALGNTSYVNMSGVWLFRVDGDVSIGGKFLCIVLSICSMDLFMIFSLSL